MKKYYSDIDGLRGVAVAFVVINHLSLGALPLGYLGVDIFFVISGFVIAQVLSLRLELDLRDFLLDFYSARLKRLLPVLLLVFTVSTLAISLVSPSPNSFLKTGLYAIFGLANISLYLQSQDYFSRAAELNPFTHMWSLGVEEQFYFFLPLFFWVAARLVGSRLFLVLLSALVVVSGVSFAVIYSQNEQFSFYMMPTRFWQLGLGVLVYFSLSRAQKYFSLYLSDFWVELAKVLLLTVMVVMASVSLDVFGPYPSILFGLVSACILLLIGGSARNSVVLSSAFLVHIGKLSYSIYLWHWPVIVILRWTFGVNISYAIAAVLITYVLSKLSYDHVELKLRYSKWSSKKYKEVAYAIFASCILACAVIVQVKVLRIDLYLGEPLVEENLGVESLTNEYRTQGGAVWRGNSCVLSSNDEVGVDIDLNDCIVGIAPYVADRRVLVMGNSFSAALVPMFDLSAFPDAAISFYVTSSWGAAPVLGMPHTGAWDLASAYYWNDLLPRFLETLQAGDFVLLANDLASFSPLTFDHEAAERLSMLRSGLIEFSQLLRSKDIELLIFSPLPFLREAECDPTAASPQWFAPNGAACNYYSRQETIQRQGPIRAMLDELARAGIIRLVDAFDVFCEGVQCGYFNDQGVLLYRDEWSHPSYTSAVLSRAYLYEAF